MLYMQLDAKWYSAFFFSILQYLFLMYVLEYSYVVTLLLRILSVPDTKFKTERTGSAKAGPEYEILNHNVNPYNI
jgi:hypothetical protein